MIQYSRFRRTAREVGPYIDIYLQNTLSLELFSLKVVQNLGVKLAGHTAVNRDLGARDVLGKVTTEKESGIGNILKIRNITDGGQFTVDDLFVAHLDPTLGLDGTG